MNSQKQLFQIGTFNFRLIHILVIGLLILSFSTSFLIRMQPTQYGFELNEFDPFFNFRATEYLIENGFEEYFEWQDDKSWFPYGRDVSINSQTMLHITTAILYQIFGSNSTLYDFTILFPAVIGSLTVIIIFLLVRVLGGTTAGVIASLLFSVSLPILIRGSAGWFKSEPLGLFYGLLGLYLFLSGITSKNKKIIIPKIIFAGIILTFGMASWGGNQFFIIPLGLFILILPLVRKDHKFLAWTIPLFVTTFLFCCTLFERPGLSFVFGIGGISLIVPTILLFVNIFIQKISKEENKIKHGVFLLIVITISIIFLLFLMGTYLTDSTSFRYLNAINPFLTSYDPLVDSVSEHATTKITDSFLFNSVFMIFAGFGAWILLTKNIFQNKILFKNDVRIFSLIIGITGVYVSSTFIRLEIFASISLIILGSIGLAILTKEIFKIKFFGKKNYLVKISYVVIISIFFTVPLVYPTYNWVSTLDYPPTILTGGTSHLPSTNDWMVTLEWIKNNTPEDAVVASWWDYGYWIQTLGDRTTLIDNSTLSSSMIIKFADMLVSTPDDAFDKLKNNLYSASYPITEKNIDYLVLFVSAEKLSQKSNSGESLYLLRGGGDETKKPWIMHIAGASTEKLLHPDGRSATEYFWNETLLGNAIPFKPFVWYENGSGNQSLSYIPGFIQIFTKEITYDYDGNTPLNLVYASPGFTNDNVGMIHGVLVFEINDNYDSIKYEFDSKLQKLN